MKFISYRTERGPGIAVDEDGGYSGLIESEAYFPGTVNALVAAGGTSLRDAAEVLRSRGHRVDSSGIELLSPVEPGRIFCVGLNYADHAKESNLPMPETPTLFSRFASSIVGPEAPIMLPKVSRDLDFEGELAVVIGKPGRYVAADKSLDHVAGYSCFNDGTIRDYQFRTPQWMIGKNFDRTGAFGPALVTPESLPRGASGLAIQTRLNGEIVQSSSTAELMFDVAKLIAYISEIFTLQPGDIIATGTPAGAGFARKPPLWMKAGDVCEVEIEGLGTLRNCVVSEA